jgi:hypothetical protein
MERKRISQMEDLVIMKDELIWKDDMNKIIKDFFTYINKHDELDFEQRYILSDYITILANRLNKIKAVTINGKVDNIEV